ncbi:ubiquinone anaerobic biosynthesis accessory factor UbiT [Polycladidibacter hongkongensis]|uniref:ubiquinone anaerobic biosynthesis accessory factor UbiT n=1 Tax=Polycladidibacter hongkongensis TaxID=1647556 RepID=UPI000834F297|nr:SCP2 sterol-binding domain-containing protein [Pseudovibrio hongkongensis]
MSELPRRGEFPLTLQKALGFLPAPPLGFVLTKAVRLLARRRPDLFERLDQYKRAHFVIDPVDLPHVFKLVPNGVHASVELLPRAKAPQGAASIRGPLVVLLGLVDGTYDGDAMFFSRDLVIEGDTDAVLALRNTMEEADLTPAELMGLSGALQTYADKAANASLRSLRRLLNAPQAG